MTSLTLDILQRINHSWHPSHLAGLSHFDADAALLEFSALLDAYKLNMTAEAFNKADQKITVFFVRTQHRFVTSLAHTFDQYLRIPITSKQRAAGLKKFYAEGFLLVERVLDLIEFYFNGWLENIQMPNAYCRHWLEQNDAAFKALEKHITELSNDEALVKLILLPYEQVRSKQSDAQITYFQWRYMKSLLSELQKLLLLEARRNTIVPIVELLVTVNFNATSVYEYLVTHVKKQMQQCEDDEQASQLLWQMMKELHQLPLKRNDGLIPDTLSLRDQLCNFLTWELDHLQPVQHPARTANTSAEKWSLALSVAAFAVIVRAAIDCKLITNVLHKQTFFFKQLAAVIRTPNSPDVSPVSFRNRVYAIENSAKDIAKDWLMRLYKQVHSY